MAGSPGLAAMEARSGVLSQHRLPSRCWCTRNVSIISVLPDERAARSAYLVVVGVLQGPVQLIVHLDKEELETRLAILALQPHPLTHPSPSPSATHSPQP